MKFTIILIVLISASHWASGQACSIYCLKYRATVKSNSGTLLRVKLPSTAFLHGLEAQNPDQSFIEYEPTDGKVDLMISSQLTSVYTNAEMLKKMYESKSDKLTLILIINENGREKEIIKKLDWNTITVTQLDSPCLGGLFEIDLKDLIAE